MAKRAPKRIWLEIWPEGTRRPDQVHYEQTGYGVDMATGRSSRIVVYERLGTATNGAKKPARKRRP